MGIWNPAFIGSARWGRCRKRSWDPALHPSHTSDSQFLCRTGNLQRYRNSNNPSRAVRVPGNPSARILLKRERGAAMPSCVPSDKSMTNPGNSSQTMDRGTFQAQSESIPPSPPHVRNANPCPTKGTFAQCPPQRWANPSIAKIPNPSEIRELVWLHLSQQLITKPGQKLLQFLYLSYSRAV